MLVRLTVPLWECNNNIKSLCGSLYKRIENNIIVSCRLSVKYTLNFIRCILWLFIINDISVSKTYTCYSIS